MLWKLLLALVFGGLVGGIGWYVTQDSHKEVYSTPTVPIEAPEPIPEPEPEPEPAPEPEPPAPLAPVREIPAPEPKAEPKPEPAPKAAQSDPNVIRPPAQLDGSDNRVRRAVNDLQISLLRFIEPREQIRKWVLVVDLMADRRFPNKNLPVSYAMPGFETLGPRQQPVLNPDNYQRMTPLVDALVTTDPARLAGYYRVWSPLFEKAYGELGKRGRFHDRLMRTFANIRSVKPLDGPIALKRPKVMYQYADPMLEASPDLDKWLWRLGPENLARLQGFTKRLEAELAKP